VYLRIEAIRVSIENYIDTAASCSGDYGVAKAKVDSNDAHACFSSVFFVCEVAATKKC
jgi:hypothetical protein